MALFKKNDTPKEAAVVADTQAVSTPKGPVVPRNTTRAIIKPRITEKAAILGEHNVYTFEIENGATKFDVRDAIKELYKVTPVRINIVHKRPRHFMSRSRGRDMMEHGLHKAYVYLKKGDRIELV